MRLLTVTAGAAAAFVAAACTTSRNDSAASDSAGATAGAKAPPNDTAPTAGPSATQRSWVVVPSGIGAIQVGMSADDLRRVAGDVSPPAGGGDCVYVRPASAPGGVSIMLAAGHVARIDVDSAGVSTDAGAGVGDSEDRINRLYAGRVTSGPHKYVAGGRYLTVSGVAPAGSANRIVFETEGGRVTKYRAGRVPEVEWVERCG